GGEKLLSPEIFYLPLTALASMGRNICSGLRRLFVKTASAGLALSLAGLHFGLMDALAQSGCVCQPPPINPTTCPHRYNWPGADRTPDGCGAKIVFLGLQIQTWFPYAPFGLPVGGCCDGHDNGWGDCQKNEIQSNNEFWNCLM